MARVKQVSPMGSSTMHPDGTLEIRTDQGMEALGKAFAFWFPPIEIPLGCDCDLMKWQDHCNKVCAEHQGADEYNCTRCGHNRQCHNPVMECDGCNQTVPMKECQGIPGAGWFCATCASKLNDKLSDSRRE